MKSERDHAVVVGGGFAGASAASALAEAGVAVTLLEERSTLGGRASSVRDGVTKQDVDNGQHLFIGAYRHTFSFLKRLGVENRVRFDPCFSLPFYNRRGERSTLEPKFFPGNLGLLTGIGLWPELSWKDRFFLLWGLARAHFSSASIADQTVSQWVSFLRQPSGTQRAFWDPLCLATLNEAPDLASAAAFRTVLKEGLMAGDKERSLGYATLPLSRLWSMELGPYLQRSDGQLALRQKATGFRVEGDRIAAVEIARESPVQADVFILATSRAHAEPLLPPPLRVCKKPMEEISFSPIVAINLWFKSPPFTDPLVGLLDMDLHWVFNRETLWGPTAAGQMTAVISAARAHADRSSADLVALALADLRLAFPNFREDPFHASVLREPHATPSTTPLFYQSRPTVETLFPNFFLAGDWVNVDLPPTLEAASQSGHRAAEGALAYLRKKKTTKNLREPMVC